MRSYAGLISALLIACGGPSSTADRSASSANPGAAASEASAAPIDGNAPDDLELLQQVDEYVYEACDCPDADCANSERQRLTAFLDTKPSPSERDEQLISDSYELIDECALELDRVNGGIVAVVKAFADEMCACSDFTCAQQVQTRFVERIKNETPPTKEQQQKILTQMERMQTCIARMKQNP